SWCVVPEVRARRARRHDGGPVPSQAQKNRRGQEPAADDTQVWRTGSLPVVRADLAPVEIQTAEAAAGPAEDAGKGLGRCTRGGGWLPSLGLIADKRGGGPLWIG